MLTEEENMRLCQVGPGTPMGNLLRRYWHPVATVPELEKEHVLPIRRLGEDLVLYQSRKGEIGLIQQRCAHRSISLGYGIPSEEGLRCAYHGWVYNAEGQCVEQPFEEIENENAGFKYKIQIDAYPVEMMAGLVFAYMGPLEKKPLLPKWETFMKDDEHRQIGWTDLPCNWMQPMENSMDPVHFEWLHANQSNWLREKQGMEPSAFPAQHQKVRFPLFEIQGNAFGIYKQRLLVGENPETSPDWLLGHPVLFPNTLALSGPTGFSFQIRVPIDDFNTYQVRFATAKPREGEEPKTSVFYVPYKRDDGSISVDGTTQQDMMAWITQGWYGARNGIAPRHLEHLGISDKGITMYRNILFQAMEAVERGEDPPGLVYDASINEPYIHYHGENEIGQARAAFSLNRDGGGGRRRAQTPTG
jgi:5,5'-dehydrodivanillate O-demethylase